MGILVGTVLGGLSKNLGHAIFSSWRQEYSYEQKNVGITQDESRDPGKNARYFAKTPDVKMTITWQLTQNK